LSRLLNHFPEAGHNGKTITRLAEDWFNLLREEQVTSLQFTHGMRWAVKHCRFFPKLVDILDGVKTYRERPPAAPEPDPNVKQLAEYTTTKENLMPQEIKRNKNMIAMITKAALRQVPVEDAVEYVEDQLKRGKNFTDDKQLKNAPK
jgi:hypothetical protein